MTLQAGKHRRPHVVGNYLFTGKLLGKGNFARVEEAIHNVLNVKVAVKVMDIRQIREEYVIRNLCREAKLMSKLNHPCIAALYQTIQGSDNVYYLVTELVSGGDLCSFVKGQRTGKLDERPTRVYARQFVSALSHMHSLGVVHRDLKMENVMLNSIQSQIKIVDFGLSNVWSPGHLLRTHCGSPEYAAPELFVTGKQYGPEVDLWSLGIILYGMVVGQLPFVSTHNEQVSSQERRKKLVAQINRGLGSQHRRALASFSPEFRNMMNKLLVADTSKRIKIKELLVHPWITDKGRKLIRTNPIKELDSHWQAKIISELAHLIDDNFEEIATAIEDEPLGDAGGMFRIVVHEHSLKLLHGDGITRNVPTLELNSLDVGGFKNTPMVSMTSRSSAKKYELSRGDHSSIARANLSVETADASMKLRPVTALPTTNLPDYRTLKSPALRRKAYSASITPKTIRVSSSPIECKRRPSSPKPKTSMERQRKQQSIDKSDSNIRKGLAEVLTNLKKLPHLERGSTKTSRDKDVRIQTAIDGKPRSKSDHRTNSRPYTTCPTHNYNLRTSKHASSDMTVTTIHSDSKAMKKAADARKMIKHKIFKSPQYLEKGLEACGDSSDKTPTGTNKMHRKPVIYDPIARCIAGYVANNVPEKIHDLARLRNRSS